MMISSIEDTLEILIGQVPRAVNIRIDNSDLKILNSIGQQISNKLALTDRQLTMIITKFQKYQTGLEQNGIDVNAVVQQKKLRYPIRNVDRTRRISLDMKDGHYVLLLQFVYNKEFVNAWEYVRPLLTGRNLPTVILHEHVATIQLTELNLYHLVTEFKKLDYDIDTQINEMYDTICNVLENPKQFLPSVTFEEGKYSLRNLHKTATNIINEEFPTVTNVLKYLNRVKMFGITNICDNIRDRVLNLDCTEYAKAITLSSENRFRINPDTAYFSQVVSTIHDLESLPLLIVMTETLNILEHLQFIIRTLIDKIPIEKITVFFRLESSHKESAKFSQYVKENKLNNYIDNTTQVVIISKTRIPKPLLKSHWKPNSAIVTASNDYGKTSVYLNEVPMVIYYNDSVTKKYDRIKERSVPIAQL